VFNSKDEQFNQFLKMNKYSNKRAHSNVRGGGVVSILIQKTTEKKDLKKQMKLLEKELFRC
jgi:hypothetical protein